MFNQAGKECSELAWNAEDVINCAHTSVAKIMKTDDSTTNEPNSTM